MLSLGSVTTFLNDLLQNPDHLGPAQWALAMVIAYFGGILSSLTPCVYPMIPITISVVGGIQLPRQGHIEHVRARWKEIFFRGIAYVLGMTVVYSFLGVVAGLTGRVFGTLTNSSAWYLGLGVVMTLAALIMVDVIPFDPVTWLQSAKRKLGFKSKTSTLVQQEMTWLGAFTLGASSGLIAAPCTTPVLTTILAYIAKTQSVGFGLSLMIAFSFGLGTLLLIIASFAGAIQVLPKSGHWMKMIKIGSGIILLVFAEYLFFRAGAIGG